LHPTALRDNVDIDVIFDCRGMVNFETAEQYFVYKANNWIPMGSDGSKPYNFYSHGCAIFPVYKKVPVFLRVCLNAN